MDMESMTLIKNMDMDMESMTLIKNMDMESMTLIKNIDIRYGYQKDEADKKTWI